MSNKWSTYETNVQSYRSNMIASQSFLLAAGMFSIDRMVLSCTCVAIALFQLWFIWFRVIRVRTIISDYHKFDLKNMFNNYGNKIVKTNECCENPLDEDTYLKNRGVRKKVNNVLSKEKHQPKLKHNMRLTRIKIDLILPISFTLLWIIIFLYSIKVII